MSLRWKAGAAEKRDHMCVIACRSLSGRTSIVYAGSERNAKQSCLVVGDVLPFGFRQQYLLEGCAEYTEDRADVDSNTLERGVHRHAAWVDYRECGLGRGYVR